jgi:hypothetical protein
VFACLSACLQGLKAKTAAMLPEVGKGKGKGRGKAAAAAAADEDEEMTEAVVGDAEGGAALAEEATAPATQRVSWFGLCWQGGGGQCNQCCWCQQGEAAGGCC